MINLEEFPNGIKIFQAPEYKFTKDSIDLAKFCNISSNDNVLELCSGCGVISFYAYDIKSFNTLYLNELQNNFYEAIEKNIELNNLQAKAFLLKGDLKNLKSCDFDKKFDVIICNPPYYKYNNEEKSVYNTCRREIKITLKEIIQKASELIKDKGKFYICITAERSAELLGELYLNNFMAKRIRYLKNEKDEVYLILVESRFNGNIGTAIEMG